MLDGNGYGECYPRGRQGLICTLKSLSIRIYIVLPFIVLWYINLCLVLHTGCWQQEIDGQDSTTPPPPNGAQNNLPRPPPSWRPEPTEAPAGSSS